MLDKIDEISLAIGNNKQKVMAQYPELCRIFEYAYNPFKKYYITAPEVGGIKNGEAISNATFIILNSLNARETSGHEALKLITWYIQTLSPKDAELFKRILNKDLLCGVSVTTINKVWPGLIPLTFNGDKKQPLMLLKTFDEKKIKFPCLVAVKKDGVRGIYDNGLISRQGQKLIGLNHIENALQDLDLILDGELCVPDCIFDIASGLIRNNQPTPNVVYWIFDSHSFSGSKVERFKKLRTNVLISQYIKLIPHYWVNCMKGLLKFYNWALKEGEEGIVIYNPESFYEDKRSYDWMRMVPQNSVDCKVIDFYEGKNRITGTLGGIIVEFNGQLVKVGSGFKQKDWYSLSPKQQEKEYEEIIYTEKTRDYIWNNQFYFLNKIAKIEYKEVTAKGSLRQPRFKGWRWDK